MLLQADELVILPIEIHSLTCIKQFDVNLCTMHKDMSGYAIMNANERGTL